MTVEAKDLRLQLRELFEKFEKGMLSDNEVKDFYNTYKSIFLEQLNNKKFLLENIFLVSILLRKKILVDDFKDYKSYYREFLKLYKNAPKFDEKSIIALILLTMQIFGGKFEEAKSDFIKMLVFLNFNKIFNNPNMRQTIFTIFKLIFPNPTEILNIYNSHIFKGSFWNKTIDEQRAAILWLSQVFFGTYSTTKDFYEIYDKILEFYLESIKREKDELVFQIQFSSSHIFLNIAQTQEEMKKYNDDFEKPLSEYIQKRLMKKYGIKENSKKFEKNKKTLKIAFVYDRIVMNSPFKVLYSLLKSLQENNNGEYEYFVYDLETIEKSPSDPKCISMIQNLGIKYVSNHRLLPYEELVKGHFFSHVKKNLNLRERIIEDDIDILIMGNNRYQFNFLFSTRTAPKQVFWSHGFAHYDVPNIDLRISHFEQEKNNFEWKIFSVPFAEEFLIGSEEEKKQGLELKKKILEKFGENTVILGTIGRLVKIDSDDYLKVIGEIMNTNPNTIYLACGTGGNLDSIKSKLKKYNIPEDRFIFTGMINPHVYGWIIDIWPDTFPLGQGQSKDEFIAKKKPVVFHIKRNIKRDDTNNFFVAKDDKEYISIVSKAINNDKKRKEIANFEYNYWYKKEKYYFTDFLYTLTSLN